MSETKVKASVARAGQAQPNGGDSLNEGSPAPSSERALDPAVGKRLGEMVEQLLAYAMSENLKPELERLGHDFEQQVAQAKASALQESLAQIENHFNAFQARLESRAQDVATQAGQALEKKAAENLASVHQSIEEAGARLTTQLETRGEQMLEQSLARLNQQMEEAATRVQQSFMRHIVTELGGKQTSFVEEAMKPLEAAAEQNLTRMRKELTRMVKEVGQRFVGGAEE